MTVLFNLKQNKTIRRNLRKQEIGAEKILWSKLNRKQLAGYKFRRQFGIGDYVVDFYCPKLKLVIEIDGATHSEEKEIEYDKARQKFIEGLGLTVKRYTNENIQKNLPEVLGDLYEICRGLKNNHTQPYPS